MQRRRQRFAQDFPATFQRWSNRQQGPTPLNPTPNIPVELPDASPSAVNQCPKCGRALGRGGHFHIKACNGHMGGRHWK